MLKKFMQRLSARDIVLFGSGLAALILGFVMVGIGRHKAGSLDTQDMAARWAANGKASQISCFFSRESGVNADSIVSFEHALDKALEEAKRGGQLAFIEVKCALGAREDLGRPTSSPSENKGAFMAGLGSGA